MQSEVDRDPGMGTSYAPKVVSVASPPQRRPLGVRIDSPNLLAFPCFVPRSVVKRYLLYKSAFMLSRYG